MDYLKEQLTDDLWRKKMEDLEEYGYCVLPAIEMNTSKALVEAFQDWQEGICEGIKRENPKTWTMNGKISVAYGGSYKHYGVGHCSALWKARELVAPIFEKLYDTTELITSYDGACLLPPQMGDDREVVRFYTTQAPLLKPTKEVAYAFNWHRNHKPFQCVQGILNLLDNGLEDGGLYVAQGSHKEHAKFFKDTKQDKQTQNWYVFGSPPKTERDFEDQHLTLAEAGKKFIEKFPKVKVTAKAGQMILFYSTLAHAVVSTTEKGSSKTLAFYISMLPKTLATKKDLEKKLLLLKNLRTTSHWACLKIQTEPLYPRVYGNTDTLLEYPADKYKVPELSLKMLMLAGCTKMEAETWLKKHKDLDWHKSFESLGVDVGRGKKRSLRE